ncbi:MAG TPA: hypothetical protein VH640_30710 [Bryobacteraceae bacterium]|jgi:hypothetical protein
MAGRFEFLDEGGRATQLVRLQIYQDGKAVAQFTNVPVQYGCIPARPFYQ